MSESILKGFLFFEIFELVRKERSGLELGAFQNYLSTWNDFPQGFNQPILVENFFFEKKALSKHQATCDIVRCFRFLFGSIQFPFPLTDN